MAPYTVNVTSINDLPPPVEGPQAWYGPDMAKSTDWLYQFDDKEIGEIEAAMRPFVKHEARIGQMTKDDFPLPTLSKRMKEVKQDLLHGHGFLVLRGLPVGEWNIRESVIAYFGIGAHLGNARSQNAKGHVLGHVYDLGRDAMNDPTARIYQTTERQTFHTDSTDVVALLCLCTSKSGGASALVSSMTIYNEMYKRRPDLLRVLFRPIATDRRGEVPEGKKPYFQIPIYSWHEGYLTCLFARRYIESAQRFEGVAPLTEEEVEALDMFEGLAENRALNLHLDFQPGDMQFVHNHTMLHDRTAFEDWPEPERKRHLLRLWLAVPGARPLPPIFAERYGKIDDGDRGGIIVPGACLNAPLEPV